MSDSTLLAKEIQDVAQALSEIPAAVLQAALTVMERKAAEAPAPMMALQIPAPVFQVPAAQPPDVVVNVEQAPAPVVNVAGPSVSVAAPAVTVEALPPQSYSIRVTKRDKEGLIQEIVMYPVQVIE